LNMCSRVGLHGDAGDWLLAAVDFLDFRDLYAFCAASHRFLLHADSALGEAESPLMRHLDRRIPSHVRWRPADDVEFQESSLPKGLKLAACTFYLARGMELYEKKSFADAESRLRLLHDMMPGRSHIMCRLADTLYGRATSLSTAAITTPPRLQRQRATVGRVASMRRTLRASRASTNTSQEEPSISEEEEDAAAEATFLNARSPASPPRAAEASAPDSHAAERPISAEQSPPTATLQTLARRICQANSPESARSGYGASASNLPVAPAQNEVEEAPSPRQLDYEGSSPEDAQRRSAALTLNTPQPDEQESEADAHDDEEASRLDVMREELLAEARALYETAYEQQPTCSYAVNGLTLFVNTRSEKLKLLERSVDLDKENPYALANLGAELFGQDDQRALSCLNRALQINPRLFYARLSKAQVHLRLGDLPAAVEAARSQLQARPDDEMAERFLTQLEFRLEVVRRRMLFV